MKGVRTFAAIASVVSLLVIAPSSLAQVENMLAEDAAAYLVSFRDMTIFQRRATVELDVRFTEGTGMTPKLHKVGPGSFISPLEDGSGFFGTSFLRVDRCRFEERYTLVGELGSQEHIEATGNEPDKVYDFRNAIFKIVPGQGGQWKLEVTGQRVFCSGTICVNSTGFQDISATPNDDVRQQKAKDLDRVIVYFQENFCPGGTR